ncbi:MAG: sugar phosphate nucleotidyltransferase [Mycoplasmatota bacterium]
MTLLILAAGLGSRFGGLKQIQPVGKNDEFIIDYSIHDAIKAGFDKIVFLIKEENEEIFKQTIGKRFENKVKIEYVFQGNQYIPDNILKQTTREKPYGTAHAILCAKDVIDENFAIINADDFYGEEAFVLLAKNLEDNVIIAYEASKTMTKTGSVKRGLVNEKNGLLTDITESILEYKKDSLYACNLDKTNNRIIKENNLVSMNMIGFNVNVFDYLKTDIEKFFKEQTNYETCEYLITDVIKGMLEKKLYFNVIKTSSKWLGITYLQDLDYVKEEINKLNYKF